jgi:hypothetical protein
MPKGNSNKIARSTEICSEVISCPCGKSIAYLSQNPQSGQTAFRLHKKVCKTLKEAPPNCETKMLESTHYTSHLDIKLDSLIQAQIKDMDKRGMKGRMEKG